MTERITKKDALRCFERLADMMGKKAQGDCWQRDKDGTLKAKVGCWHLDHSTYGGYVVEEMTNEKGGVTQPFGAIRRSARDFCDAVSMIGYAMDYKKRGRR